MDNAWKRAIWFFSKRSIALVVVALLMWFCFGIAMNMSSIYIIVCDGMQKRADVILHTGTPDQNEAAELYEYFLPETLQQDPILASDNYAEYTVSNYDYTTRIERIRVFPWSRRATVKMNELVSRIDGSLNEAAAQENADLPTTPPGWEARRYEIIMTKTEENRWYISKITPLSPEEGEETEE